MGTSRDFAELAGKLGSLPAEIDKGMYQATRTAANIAVRTIRGQIAQDTGGSMRLSGVGKKGARVNVRYGKVSTRDPHNPAAYIYAKGPLHLLESDTQPHEIPRANRRKKKVLRFPGNNGIVFTRKVDHPGTRGKHPFKRGAKKASVPAAKAYEIELKKVMGKVFT